LSVEYPELRIAEAVQVLGVRGPWSLVKAGNLSTHQIDTQRKRGWLSWEAAQRLGENSGKPCPVLWRGYGRALRRRLTADERHPALTVARLAKYAVYNTQDSEFGHDTLAMMGEQAGWNATLKPTHALTLIEAEDACFELGFHPVDVWPEWWRIVGDIELQVIAAREVRASWLEREWAKKDYWRNPERMREKARERHHNDRDRRNKLRHERYARNKEAEKERRRAYYLANRERELAQQRERDRRKAAERRAAREEGAA
jgi:hypothetical protein